MNSTISFFVFVPILSIILLNITFMLATHKPYKEKKTPFECGYHSFLSQNRTQFTISFFIFALLFLIFDLEIVLIYPVTVSSYFNTIYGIIVVILFVLILTLGFVFELGKKALTIFTRQSNSILFSMFPLLSFFNKKRFSSSYKTLIFSFVSVMLCVSDIILSMEFSNFLSIEIFYELINDICNYFFNGGLHYAHNGTEINNITSEMNNNISFMEKAGESSITGDNHDPGEGSSKSTYNKNNNDPGEGSSKSTNNNNNTQGDKATTDKSSDNTKSLTDIKKQIRLDYSNDKLKIPKGFSTTFREKFVNDKTKEIMKKEKRKFTKREIESINKEYYDIYNNENNIYMHGDFISPGDSLKKVEAVKERWRKEYVAEESKKLRGPIIKQDTNTMNNEAEGKWREFKFNLLKFSVDMNDVKSKIKKKFYYSSSSSSSEDLAESVRKGKKRKRN